MYVSHGNMYTWTAPLWGELAIGPPTFKCINFLLAKLWFRIFFAKEFSTPNNR